MFNKLKSKVKKYMGGLPLEIDGISYSFTQQTMILQNHLKLVNVGFGVPHPSFELGEIILDKWISLLEENNDELLEGDSAEYRRTLNDSFRLPDNEQQEFLRQYYAGRDLRQDIEPLNNRVPIAQDQEIRVFEGFAGYGGASFGLRRSGLRYRVVGMSENNKYASQLLAANFPEIRNWGDITRIIPEELPDFDLFTGGFPCQPFSSAGMQMGEEDRYGRGTLFYEIMRILLVKRPRYILLENVKGFIAKKFEPTRNRIMEILRELGYGELQYAVLNSCDYGIPQNRERVWMFAMQGGVPEGFNLVPPKVKLTRRFGDLLDTNPPEYLYLSQAQIAHLKEKHNIPSFVVTEPLCFDVYNKKIKTNALSITITQPEHNSLRVVEVPKEDGLEIVRKMSVDEQFRFMGFEDGELNYAGQSYSQLSTRAGNGWDVNLVGILLNHIFSQIL